MWNDHEPRSEQLASDVFYIRGLAQLAAEALKSGDIAAAETDLAGIETQVDLVVEKIRSLDLT